MLKRIYIDNFRCIDEPENFLALPQVQPWLTLLYDYVAMVNFKRCSFPTTPC